MFRWVGKLGSASLALAFCGPALAQGGDVNTQWLAGTWSDRADCSQRVHFLADGRFIVPDGGEGRWRLESNVIVLSTSVEERRMAIERLDQNSLRSEGVISYRCEGRSAAQ